jgi:hypothetical protein
MRIGARCEGLSLLFSFLSLARFPFFKGRFWKPFKKEEFSNSLPYFLKR